MPEGDAAIRGDVYSHLLSGIAAGGTVIQALGQSATPRLATYYGAGNAVAFRDLLLKLLGIGVLLGIASVVVALLAGQELLTILHNPEYAEKIDVLL